MHLLMIFLHLMSQFLNLLLDYTLRMNWCSMISMAMDLLIICSNHTMILLLIFCLDFNHKETECLISNPFITTIALSEIWPKQIEMLSKDFMLLFSHSTLLLILLLQISCLAHSLKIYLMLLVVLVFQLMMVKLTL